jgi:hypothetical protein
MSLKEMDLLWEEAKRMRIKIEIENASFHRNEI